MQIDNGQVLTTIDDPLQREPTESCGLLEEGRILYFPKTPFEFPKTEQQFLVGLRHAEGHFHKNIAYRPKQDRITGLPKLDPDKEVRLHRILRAYSMRVVKFLSWFLSPYAQSWQLDYASFRPFQEAGRELRLRARNDLLHVDNFPTRPTNGNLILRFFTNINPTEARHWVTTDPFEKLIEAFGGSDKLPWPQPLTGLRSLKYRVLKAGQSVGLPVAARPPYDEFMLRFHHVMKEDQAFQENCPKIHMRFPPLSSWMVFTDRVAHAALSGQYALEQTILIRRGSLVAPHKSPASIIESRCGRSLLVERNP